MAPASKLRDASLLGLIVAGGATVRFVGLGFGLPHNGVRPDELTLIARVMNFFSGDLNPHFFSYPSFQMYLLFALFKAYFLLGRALGYFHSLADFIAAYVQDPSTFFLISRAVSAVSGTLCIMVVYRAALLILDRSTAILAAFFLAFAYLHARDSHFGTTDILVTLLVMTSYLFLLEAWNGPTHRTLALAGLFGGLAASTKYMGVLLWIPAYLVLLLRPSLSETSKRWLPGSGLVTYLLAFLASFIAGSPFAVLEPGQVRADFAREVRAVWALGYPLPAGWIYHLRISLFYGLGPPLLLVSLAGCLVLLRRDWRKGVVLLSFPTVYYVLMGKGNRDFVRYAVPLIPFLCLTAAALIGEFGFWVQARFSRRAAVTSLAALALLVVMPSLNAIRRFDSLLLREDTRVLARRFVEGSIPRGSAILEVSSDFGYLDLSPTLPQLEKEAAESESEGIVNRMIAQARLAAVQNTSRPGYELWRYDPTSKKFLEQGEEVSGFPDFLILEDSPLRFYPANVPAEIHELMKRSYALETSFIAYSPLPRGYLFNELDAFYVPFAGFVGYDRPGPNIFLYRKSEPGNLPVAPDPPVLP
jgi:4-amino-4-deoxy-L-arabinose transferase-like glycosyltransferase